MIDGASLTTHMLYISWFKMVRMLLGFDSLLPNQLRVQTSLGANGDFLSDFNAPF
jgi:hypothetical protein